MTKVFISLLFLVQIAAAATFDQVLEKYASASSIKFNITKTDEKKILGTKSKSSGVIKVQKNKIFISLDGEKKSEFYYSGGPLTLVDYPDKDFDPNGKRKVIIFKKSNVALVKNLMSMFYNSKSFSKEFTASKTSIEGGTETVEFTSKQNKINNLVIKSNIANKSIEQISFDDDAKNKITINLNNEKLNEKMSKGSFVYSVKANDEVITQ